MNFSTKEGSNKHIKWFWLGQRDVQIPEWENQNNSTRKCERPRLFWYQYWHQNLSSSTWTLLLSTVLKHSNAGYAYPRINLKTQIPRKCMDQNPEIKVTFLCLNVNKLCIKTTNKKLVNDLHKYSVNEFTQHVFSISLLNPPIWAIFPRGSINIFLKKYKTFH